MNVSVLILIGTVGLAGLVLLLLGRTGRKLGSLLIVLSLGCAGHIVHRAARCSYEFDLINLGETTEKVQKRLGTPSDTTDCSTTFGGYKRTQYDPPARGCATEYWYYAVWAPEAWSYTFDEGGHLIDKYHWVSP